MSGELRSGHARRGKAVEVTWGWVLFDMVWRCEAATVGCCAVVWITVEQITSSLGSVLW